MLNTTLARTTLEFDAEQDGSLAEMFLQNHKAGSAAGILAQDSAVICSLALQFGAPLDVIRRALMRDAQGRAASPLGVALDCIHAKEERP